jgi:SAM-dependent methyltransferase
MLQGDHDIYASAPLRRLLDDQTRAIAPDLQRCFGTHALLLSAVGTDVPPVLPMLGYWAGLQATSEGYLGDLVASVDSGLPFVTDAFELVLLRHALEVVPDAAELLSEAVRVLAPGGSIVVTGLHPLSAWAPWFYWRTRRGSPHLRAWTPAWLKRRLQRAGLEIQRTQRVGRAWPGSSSPPSGPASAFGGGYVLVARKRHRVVSPLRKKAAVVRVRASSGLSPGARRSSGPY